MYYLLIGLGVLVLIYFFGRFFPDSFIGRFLGFPSRKSKAPVATPVPTEPLAAAQFTVDKAVGDVQIQAKNIGTFGAMIKGALCDIGHLLKDVSALETNLQRRVLRIRELRAAGQGESQDAKRVKRGGIVRANELVARKKLLERAEGNLARYRKSFDDATARLKNARERVNEALGSLKTKAADLNTSEFDHVLAESIIALVGPDSDITGLDEAVAVASKRIDAENAAVRVLQTPGEEDDLGRDFQVGAEHQAGRQLFDKLLTAEPGEGIASAPAG